MDFPTPESVLGNSQLIAAIAAALNRLREGGRLSPSSFGQTIKNYITIFYPEFPGKGSYEISRWRLQVYERLYNRFKADALDAGVSEKQIPAPGKFDALPEKLEGLGVFESVQIFGEEFGNQLADTFGADLAAIRWFFRNLYWLLPLGVLLYFSPRIIAAFREAMK